MEACRDYRKLKEWGYPPGASLKLVGDRYRLSREQRQCLTRGVVERAVAEERARKMVSADGVRGAPLGLDWFNIIITVESYLKGTALFLADDGVVRDCGGVHGSWRKSRVTDRAVREILTVVSRLSPARVDAVLDAPLAHSGLMAEELRGKLTVLGMAHEVRLERSADFPLKSYEGIVASSDSAILDRVGRALDLPRLVLEDSFGFSPPPLARLEGPPPG